MSWLSPKFLHFGPFGGRLPNTPAHSRGSIPARLGDARILLNLPGLQYSYHLTTDIYPSIPRLSP
jgi:hypothetical protein